MASKNAIRVIVDTILWISWLISRDLKKLDKIFLDKKTKLIFSLELLEEFIEVANRPKLRKYFKKEDLEVLIGLIDEKAEFISVKSNLDLCRDPKDNFLLSLAIDSKANYLLTGDNDLLELKTLKQTQIITIADFIQRLK
jgi:putative PIN family toxin of toxin-antitoxin system